MKSKLKPVKAANASLSAASLRRHAEAQLRIRQNRPRADGEPAKLEANPPRLFHELQVHQIELEMQNIELQESQNRMEMSVEKYTDLYDFAPVGYFSLDDQGRILEVNLTGATLLGVNRAQLIKQRLSPLIAPASRPVFLAFLAQVFVSPEKKICEVALMQKDGAFLWARFHGIAALAISGSKKWCRVTVSDITAHKLADQRVIASETRYRRLFEAAHDGVLLLDPETRKITEANPFMTRLLGYTRDQLVGKELFEIGLLKDEADSQIMFRKLKRQHEVRYEDLPLENRDGRHQEVEVVANLYQENEHATIQCNIRDITERKMAEMALTRLAAIVEFSTDAIISKDPNGIITSWNKSAEKIFGYTADEMTGTSILRLIPASRHAEEKMILGKISRGESVQHFETLRQTKDGRLINVAVTVSPIKDAAGKVVGVSKVARDVTSLKQAEAAQRRVEMLSASNRKLESEIVQRKVVEDSLKKSEQEQRQLLVQSRRMQEQLRELSRQVLQAQEDERKRISRELHDVIAQTLTGINIRLAALKNEAGRNTKGLERSITRTQRLVEKSVDIVHRFARELRPAVLDDLGLIPALQTFVKLFAERTRIFVDVEIFAGVEQLDGNKRTILYRVAQEALNNVARHAEAGRVEVSIQKIADHVCMKIKDDGKSFNMDGVLRAKGRKRLGLLGMRERLEMVGGQFEIESAPGRGTTVTAQIPLGKLARGGGGNR